MQTIQLNIGLNQNNGESLDRFFTEKFIQWTLSSRYTILDFKARLDQSETESTLVIKFNSVANYRYVRQSIQFFANALLQDCIASKVNGIGELVYSEYPKNDWGNFNEEHFINY